MNFDPNINRIYIYPNIGQVQNLSGYIETSGTSVITDYGNGNLESIGINAGTDFGTGKLESIGINTGTDFGNSAYINNYASCPNGEVIVGLTGVLGGYSNGITSISCQAADTISSGVSNPITIKPSNMPKGCSNQEMNFQCPPGTALNYVGYGYNGDYITALTFDCNPVPFAPSGTGSARGTLGTQYSGNNNSPIRLPQYNFVTGLGGQMYSATSNCDQYIDFYVDYGNFELLMDPTNSQEGQLYCALGELSNNCGNINPSNSVAVLAPYCSDAANIGTDTCKKWCTLNSTNATYCESAVNNFCAESANKNDPFCSCLNSPAGRSLSYCIDGTCITSGFLTPNMYSVKCPNNVSCTQINQLQSDGLTDIVATYAQNCTGAATPSTGTSSTTPSTGTTSTGTSSTTPSTSPKSASTSPFTPIEKYFSKTSKEKLIFIFILFVIVIITVIFLISSHNKSEKIKLH